MTTAVEAPAVRARAITRRYGDRVVLHELDLEIRRGEFVALIGKSGCGKTTLLRTLAGLDDLDGGDLAVPSSSTVVFQEHRLLPWEKVWRNVALNLPRAGALARALVREPELLLLDEPFAALTRIRMHGLVRDLISRHRPAVLLVTHDVDEAILLADRVLTMRDGRIAADHRVSAPARARGHAEFVTLRSELLAELGVAEL